MPTRHFDWYQFRSPSFAIKQHLQIQILFSQYALMVFYFLNSFAMQEKTFYLSSLRSAGKNPQKIYRFLKKVSWVSTFFLDQKSRFRNSEEVLELGSYFIEASKRFV